MNEQAPTHLLSVKEYTIIVWQLVKNLLIKDIR